MSAPEVCWRLAAKVRDLRERCNAPRWFSSRPAADLLDGPHWTLQDCGTPQPAGPAGDAVAREARQAAWCGSLLQRADAICNQRLNILNLENCQVGSVPSWNLDYESGRAAPLSPASTIDYRDRRIAGDAKLVWEPNRHQHLPVLAWAWRVSGERRYAEKIAADLRSWLDQCPCGRGMNWRSPLELAIRLINWVWALDLIRPAGAIDAELADRLLVCADQHVREITRKYSKYSSANNHLIGEAAGVLAASTFFHGLRGAAAWARESRHILVEQMERQVFSDGGHAELASGYHLFVLEFFTVAALCARRAACDFPPAFYSRLERMYEFVAALAAAGPLPQFGDADDGCVLACGSPARRTAEWLAVGAAVLQRPDLRIDPGCNEAAFWLAGTSESGDLSSATPARSPTRALQSQAFPDSGYFLLQHGTPDSTDALSVAFDAGPLGMGSIAAHGHADCLSFTLRACGVDVFVDPGTYDYFTWPAWRDYFRSTRAHNTIEVDGLDQSEMLGPFMWGRRAACRRLSWKPTPQGGSISAEHDGYLRRCGVMHRRTLALDGPAACIDIRDQLTGRGPHRAALCFHLAESCVVERGGDGAWLIDYGPGRLRLQLDPRLQVRGHFGSCAPIAGWVSRGYHRKTPAVTLIGECRWVDALELNTRIEMRAEGRGPRNECD
jgi:hypothetical protein